MTEQNFFIHIERKPQNRFITFRREVDAIPTDLIEEWRKLSEPLGVNEEDLQEVFENSKKLNFGKVLGKFRLLLGLSRGSLAKRWQISYSTIRDLEDFSYQRKWIVADVYGKIIDGVKEDLGEEAAQFLSERRLSEEDLPQTRIAAKKKRFRYTRSYDFMELPLEVLTSGQLLRKSRIEARMNQAELARIIGVHFSLISKMENDRRKLTSARAEKIITAFG